MGNAVGFACLVFLAVTAGEASFPGQQFRHKENSVYFADNQLERKREMTKPRCLHAGGQCQLRSQECDGVVRTGKAYCKNPWNYGCCIPPGCVLNFKTYQDGTIIEYGCVELHCRKGNWYPETNIFSNCGLCKVWGDPHITPYDPHVMFNGTQNIILTQYPDYLYGRTVLSQPSEPLSEVFGVHAEFTDCYSLIDGELVSCVRKAFFYEPGVDVTLILPKDLNNIDECYYNEANWGKPECSQTKILINDEERTFVNGAPATSFYGTDGTVLIWTEECVPSQPSSEPICQYIYVLGSKGITIQLLVDPSHDLQYSVNIYPSKSKLLDKLFGLCDVFTGETVYDGFTLRNGTMITIYVENERPFTDFLESWRV